MTCERCHGCVVQEQFLDALDDTGRLGFSGWRCINCGDVFDGVVLQHRTAGTSGPYRSQRRWSGWSPRPGGASRTD